MSQARETAAKRLQDALESAGAQEFQLRLYVLGATTASQRAVRNLIALCERELPGRYVLEVVDVHQHAHRAAADQVLATPTLVRLLPRPVARVLGDLSDAERVVVALDLHLYGRSALDRRGQQR